MRREVVKVQVPLMGDVDHVLVYAKGGAHLSRQTFTTNVSRALGGEVKGYFLAKWEDDKWTIGRRVEDQPW